MQALIRIAAAVAFAFTGVTGARLALFGGADLDGDANPAALDAAAASEASISAGSDAFSGAAAGPVAAGGASSDIVVHVVLPEPQDGFLLTTEASRRSDAADDPSPFPASADIKATVATDLPDHLRSMTRTNGSADLDAQLQGHAGESAGALVVGGATELALRTR